VLALATHFQLNTMLHHANNVIIIYILIKNKIVLSVVRLELVKKNFLKFNLSLNNLKIYQGRIVFSVNWDIILHLKIQTLVFNVILDIMLINMELANVQNVRKDKYKRLYNICK